MGEGTQRGNQASARAHETCKALVLRKAFNVYDKDGSGTIDYEELRRLLQDLCWPCDDAFVQRAITVLDTDNSGEIGFSEFLKWTEFAYSARILYRDEVCPSPVGASQPKVEACEVQGAQSSPWIRRVLQENNQQLERARSGMGSTPLSTVFEESECQSEYERHCNYPKESQASGENMEGLPSNFTLLSPRRRGGHGSANSLRQGRFSSACSRLGGDERTGGDDEVEFSAPITKMAKMALGQNADLRGTTSRIRSKSVEGFQRFEDVPRGRERNRGEGKKSGPRVRSKATARMLWACEQLGSKSMADDSEEEELDTPSARKSIQPVTSMGGKRMKPEDEEGNKVLMPAFRSEGSRSRRFSCVENPSWFAKVSNQTKVTEKSKVVRVMDVKKTSSI
ncbi:hypothetical protein FGB62_163g053 [Gracilaria domingensis]|nr:hypothetical protein FGB62_163g053 [Gracilaria domingensis]